jgi:hypothetical protein
MRRLIHLLIACILILLPADAKTAVMTLIVIPDNQNYTDSSAGQSMNIAQVTYAQSVHPAAFISVGDNLNFTGNSVEKANMSAWASALQTSGMNWISVPGNHDYDSIDHFGSGVRDETTWEGIVGTAMASQSGMHTGFPTGTHGNSWIDIGSWGGHHWGVLSLELCPSTSALSWADSVLAANPTYLFVITTHLYTTDLGTLADGGRNGNPCTFYTTHNFNNAQSVFTNFIANHDDQIEMVVSGHYVDNNFPDFSARRTDVGIHGNTVNEVYFDAQSFTNGGNGYLRKMVLNDDSTVDVVTYSPVLNAFQTDAADQFSMTFFGTFTPSGGGPSSTSEGGQTIVSTGNHRKIFSGTPTPPVGCTRVVVSPTVYRDFCTASTTWSATTNGSNITVEAIGGGGGGCSAYHGGSNTNQLGGGGGGEYAKEASIAYSSGTNITLTVGAAGLGSVVSNCSGVSSNATAGGTTTAAFGTSVVAHGGNNCDYTTTAAAGGTGSTNTTHSNGGAAGTPAAHSSGGGGGGAGGPNGVGGKGGNANTGSSQAGTGGGGGSGGGAAGGNASTSVSGAGGANNTASQAGGAAGIFGGTCPSPGTFDGQNGTGDSHGASGGGGGNTSTSCTGSQFNGLAGNGGAGQEWDATHGSGGGGGASGANPGGAALWTHKGGNGGLYGGGGAAASRQGTCSDPTKMGDGGDGGQGLVVITFTHP